MADPALKTMIETLHAKVQALAGSSTATAEELAMLSFATEKIAGHISAVELEAIADDLKASIVAAAGSKTGEISAAAQLAINTVSDRLAQILDEATAAEAAFNTNAAARTQALVNTGKTAEDAVKVVGAEMQQKVSDVALENLFDAPIAPGSVTYNARGFATGYVSGPLAYSDAVYDGQDRLLAYTQTVTRSDGSKLSWRYSVTYHPTTGEMISRTRVAA